MQLFRYRMSVPAMRRMMSLEFWALVATIVPPTYGIIAGLARVVRRKLAERSLAAQLGREIFSFSPSEIVTSARTYVRPDCQTIDPAIYAEPLHDPTLNPRPLFDVLDVFVREESSRFLFILGDSGTGKTSALLNYYVARRKSRFRLAVVSLASPAADAHIQSIADKGATTLLLDALDEDAALIASRKRFRDLLAHAETFRKLIVTCRSQFFLTDTELLSLTSAQIVGPRPAGVPTRRPSTRIYITPLSDTQLREAVRRRVTFWQWRLRRRSYRLLDRAPRLMPRPMLAAHVTELAKRPRPWRYPYQLYEQIVDAWLQREYNIPHERALMKSFLAVLATNIFEESLRRSGESISADELRELIRSHEIDATPADVMVRSLLNRSSDDRWKFAHRSILEHLAVEEFWNGRWTTGERVWTDQMWSFLLQRLAACLSGLDFIPPSDLPWLASLTARSRESLATWASYVLRAADDDVATARACLYLLSALIGPDAVTIGTTLFDVTPTGQGTRTIRIVAQAGRGSSLTFECRTPIGPFYARDPHLSVPTFITNLLDTTSQVLVLPLLHESRGSRFVMFEFDSGASVQFDVAKEIAGELVEWDEP